MYEQLINLLNDGKIKDLKAELNELNSFDAAKFFEILPDDKKLIVFRLLTKDNAAETFSYMDSDLQEHIIKSISDNEIRNIVDEMFIDDTVDFLSELPANLVTKVIRNADESKRKLINQFLNYPDNSAGSIMTIEFVQFHEDMTAQAAMAQLKATGVNKETIYNCYVVNSKRILMGILPLRTLILAKDDEIVKDLMEDRVISVKTLDDQEEVAEIFKDYNFISLPVVDNEARLVGIITVDDIMDVIDQENTEDFEKMSALLPSEDQYLKTSVFTLTKNRIIWLMVLMISGTISASIISHYQYVLTSVLALSAYMTILTGTGGNSGSQASTLIIRGMALGEIEMKDVLKVLWKEVRVGMLCGLLLGAVNFVRLLIFDNVTLSVNLTVSLTMAVIVVVAKGIGCTLPMLAKKIGFDPAIMAGPLITTVVDAISLLIYFKIATLLLL
ncbi:MAG: magnesium transporter [Christensenellales bacterium]|nr:magnesium transporter [Clostridiales bacterium]PWM07018.1 MAG: magnesium transporter [Clostridiales bacterium]